MLKYAAMMTNLVGIISCVHDFIVNIIIDAFGLALFINALLFVPQIYRIAKLRSSKGVSFITFGGFLLINMLAVAYGVIKHDPVLMIGYLLSAVLNFILVVLIILYRE